MGLVWSTFDFTLKNAFECIRYHISGFELDNIILAKVIWTCQLRRVLSELKLRQVVSVNIFTSLVYGQFSLFDNSKAYSMVQRFNKDECIQ